MVESLESPYILAARAGDFATLVLENSAKGPVLVNFWSRKAGPCLRQYPLLDRLVHRLDGRLLLVNVDVDAEPGIAREYGVTSVPTLKLFRKGRVVQTRHGYQDAGELEALVQYYVARDSDAVLGRAVGLFAEGRRQAAYQALADAIVEDPVNPRLPLAMAKLLSHEGRFEEAQRLLDALPRELQQYDELLEFRILTGFRIEAGEETDAVLERSLQETPEDPGLLRRKAARHVLKGEYREALAVLEALLAHPEAPVREAARRALLRLLGLLEEADPLRNACQRLLHRDAP
ncbi:MAG: hypothetical protein D6721_01915 [Gammaproteobacteria bacterium]|nr:MAG: hypothetical protein D6721_01915 [Gammaproteobacteria bacterium]